MPHTSTARAYYARPLPPARRDPAGPRLRAEHDADALLLGRPIVVSAAAARRGALRLRAALAETTEPGEAERLTALATCLEQHAGCAS